MSVPRLDLAPKRAHAFSLLNPLDYLRLLYWVFFFPQAIRWYVDRFGEVRYEEGEGSYRGLWAVLRADVVLRSLVFQGLCLTLLTPVAIAGLLDWYGAAINWGGVAGGVAVGVIFGVAYGVTGGVAVCVAAGVAFGVTFGVTYGLMLGVAQEVAYGVAGGIALGVAGGVAVGISLGVAEGVAAGVALGVTIGLTYGLLGAIAVALGVGVTGGMVMSLAFVASMAIFVLRLPDYMLFVVPNMWHWRQKREKYVLWSRMAWIPFPFIRHKISAWLREAPQSGMANVNELLAYSYQFIPVVQGVNDWLSEVEARDVLCAVNQVVDDPFDWYLVRFASARLDNAMTDSAMESLFVPEPLRQRSVNLDLRLDTPARAACAGYWYLHKQDIDQACLAFEQVRSLPYGETFYQSVLALNLAHCCLNFESIVAWQVKTSWLTTLDLHAEDAENAECAENQSPTPQSPLRMETLATLQRLRHISLEATVAQESVSLLNRSAALNRALSELGQLIEEVEHDCPYPEWPLVKRIAQEWRDLILAKTAGEIGSIAITKPVDNPFVVGNPVLGSLFVGREEIFSRLEELWGHADSTAGRDSVVLYGHRRMGKTSILQNLGQHRFGLNTIVAQFTMQSVGRVAHTGELLSYFAFAIFDALEDAGLANNLPEPDTEQYERNWYRTFNRFLRTIKKEIGQRRLILTIDEFEIIENQIKRGFIEPELLDFLRGVIHKESWLLLALAGLHTLQEMTQDYWNPLFASVTPVSVSFLSQAATAQLLANPTPDFPLDFTRATISHIYGLVKGQPYLTQLIGHSLVRLYNESVFEAKQGREARFTPHDVDQVVNRPAFYEQGSYYFNGIWVQATHSGAAGQIPLMQTLAASDEPLSAEDLFAQTALSPQQAHDSLKTLIQHDVVVLQEAQTYDFAVPLMRRWIREHKPAPQ